jgi:hypothetical protein
METDVRRDWLGILEHRNDKMNVMRRETSLQLQRPMLTSRE